MYKKILVALDASETSRRALGEAMALAQHFGAALRLLHVIDESPAVDNMEMPSQLEQYERAVRDAGERLLSEALATVNGQGLKAETVLKLTLQHPADEIVAEAGRWPADLIVIGTHGRRGLRRLFLGSVAEGVARLAEQPVLLVRAAPSAHAVSRVD